MPPGRRMALIIGNDSYEHLDQLEQSEKDGELMDATLKNLGFQTQVHFNLTNDAMKMAINNFGNKIRDFDVVVFYYSGHGGQKGLENYLFGVDAQVEVNSDEEIGVSFNKVVIRQSLNNYYCPYIIVLDACRLPLARFLRIKGIGQMPMEAVNADHLKMTISCLPEDIQTKQYDIVFSCQPGKFTPENVANDHGYLSEALAENLTRPQKWCEAVVNVINQVSQESGFKQQPSVQLNIRKHIEFVATSADLGIYQGEGAARETSQQERETFQLENSGGEYEQEIQVLADEQNQEMVQCSIPVEIFGKVYMFSVKIFTALLRPFQNRRVLKTQVRKELSDIKKSQLNLEKELASIKQLLSQNNVIKLNPEQIQNQNFDQPKKTSKMSTFSENVVQTQQNLSEYINDLQNDLFQSQIQNFSNIFSKLQQIQDQLSLLLSNTQQMMQEFQNIKNNNQKMSINIFNLQFIFPEQNDDSKIKLLQNQLNNFGANVKQQVDTKQDSFDNNTAKKIFQELISQLKTMFEKLQKQMEESFSDEFSNSQISVKFKEIWEIFNKLQNQTDQFLNESEDIQDINQNLKSKFSQLQEAFVESVNNDSDDKNFQTQIEIIQNVLDQIKNEPLQNVQNKNERRKKRDKKQVSKNQHKNVDVPSESSSSQIDSVDHVKNLTVLDEIQFLRNQVEQLSRENQQYQQTPIKSEEELLKERIGAVENQCEKLGKNQQGLSMFNYKAHPFTNQEEREAFRLIMLGETFCGKTTLINTFLNFVLGVKFEDPFRFYLTKEYTKNNQYLEKASDITEYRINAHNGYPPIILIDTPGFGDTCGIENQDRIFQHFSKYLQNTQCLHAVCMVVKSYICRESSYQNYIFDSVFNLFGKDIIENLICLVTFCDVGQPAIVDALQSEAYDIREHITKIQPPWYLKFNNIGLFCKNQYESGEEQDRIFEQQYFDMCKVGFEQFFAKFCKLEPKTLDLTKQQLNLKEQLEYNMEMMNRLDLQCETHQRNIEQLTQSIKNNQIKINANKDYMIAQQKLNINQRATPPGQHTTQCMSCNRTCETNSSIPNDSEKYKSIVMDSNGYCTQCPGKCHWSRHSNLPYIIELVTTTDYVKNEGMFTVYQNALNEKNRVENLLKQAGEQQMTASLQCQEYRQKITDALKQLKTIALKKVDSTSMIEYIELQIKVLEEEKPPNYHHRVKQLKDQKKKYENLQKMMQ